MSVLPDRPRRRQRRRDHGGVGRATPFFAIGLAVVVGAGALAGAPALAHADSTPGIFADDLQPQIKVDPDRAPVELGVRFSPQDSGRVTALQYYQGRATTGVRSATLWSSTGAQLARATFSESSAEGWRTITLPRPVAVKAGTTYVVSYYAPRGAYPAIEDDLTRGRTQNGFQLTAGAGVYHYGTKGGFPRRTYQGSNYLADIVFEKTPTSTPAPRQTPTMPGTQTPTASRTPTPKPTPSRTPTPTPTPTPPSSPTPAPTPSATSVPTTPTPTTPPGSGTSAVGWTVNQATVGLAPLGLSCQNLPAYTGSSDVPRGTVISGRRVTTPLNLSAGAITIERSCIQPTTAWRGLPLLSTMDNNTFVIASERVTIRDSEIDGSLLDTESAAWATGFMGVADLVGNYFHHLGSGIAIMHSGETLDILVERNYVTDLIAWGNPATTGNHTDAFTVRDFTAAKRSDRQLIIRNNRFISDSGNDTGALFIQTYSGRIDNTLIQGNLLEGAGYQLGLNQLNNPYSKLRAVNNRFSGTGFGATYAQRGPGWTEWSNNYIYSPSAPDGRGAVVGKP